MTIYGGVKCQPLVLTEGLTGLDGRSQKRCYCQDLSILTTNIKNGIYRRENSKCQACQARQYWKNFFAGSVGKGLKLAIYLHISHLQCKTGVDRG
jgi:hypothetical protein